MEIIINDICDYWVEIKTGNHLRDYIPADLNNFFLSTVEVHLSDKETLKLHPNANDRYLCQVTTPSFLLSNPNILPINARAVILMNTWNYDELYELIKKIIDKCDKTNWKIFSADMDRYFLYEIESTNISIKVAQNIN